MAKKFTNINRNVNTGSSLDEITSFKSSTLEEVKQKDTPVNKEYKNYLLKLPIEYHSKLKFKISEKSGKNINELIIEAIEKAYPDLNI